MKREIEYDKNYELREAVWGGNLSKVKDLVENGADVNSLDTHGLSVLTTAILNDVDTGIITYLIKAGADINYQDEEKKTALMYAAIGGRFPIVQCLVEAGADLDIVGRGLVTADKYALRYAQQTNNCEILEYLTKAAEKNIKVIADQIVNKTTDKAVGKKEINRLIDYLNSIDIPATSIECLLLEIERFLNEIGE